MKVPASIRKLYEDQDEVCRKLQTRVDNILRPRLHERWHYESRIKTLESFTLKIESGRFDNPSSLEDFFGATIVVRNGEEINDAENLALELFLPQYRRPKSNSETHMRPEEFAFDDLRLYVRWKDDPSLPPTGCDGCLFELQIKTFLQHAWSIATHDLIYKTDEANWSKMRIAYQTKAMLEHAEISIQEANSLSASIALAKTNARTASLKTFIKMMTSLWPKADLPTDVRRLAENVLGLAQMAGLDAKGLEDLLLEEEKQGRGPQTRNLSPYGVVLQTLLLHKKEDMSSALSEKRTPTFVRKQKVRVLLPKELEIPSEIDSSTWKDNAVFVK